MRITRGQLEYIADLARLNLTEEEKERLIKEMNSMLAFADKLNELDTTGVEPTIHMVPVYNVFREDIVSTSYERESILKNAPSKEQGCFKVPNIVNLQQE